MMTKSEKVAGGAHGKRGRQPKDAAVFRSAKQAFAAHGYAGVTMDMVAQIAGVTKATVYAHAASKKDLFTRTVHEAIALSRASLLPLDFKKSDARPDQRVIENYLARLVEITCFSGSIGLQRAVLANPSVFENEATLMMEAILLPAEQELARYLSDCGINQPAIKAQSCFAAAVTRRQFHTLMGIAAPLPNPPSGPTIQQGALDQAVEAAVSDLFGSCRGNSF